MGLMGPWVISMGPQIQGPSPRTHSAVYMRTNGLQMVVLKGCFERMFWEDVLRGCFERMFCKDVLEGRFRRTF
jgi:hypothetical protein